MIGLETILQNNLRVISCKQLSFVAVSWRDHRQKFVYVGNRIKIISFRLLSYCLSTNQKVPEYPFILYVKQSYQHTTSIQHREFFFISIQTGKEDKFMLQYTMNNNKELSQRIIIFVHR